MTCFSDNTEHWTCEIQLGKGHIQVSLHMCWAGWKGCYPCLNWWEVTQWCPFQKSISEECSEFTSESFWYIFPFLIPFSSSMLLRGFHHNPNIGLRKTCCWGWSGSLVWLKPACAALLHVSHTDSLKTIINWCQNKRLYNTSKLKGNKKQNAASLILYKHSFIDSVATILIPTLWEFSPNKLHLLQ